MEQWFVTSIVPHFSWALAKNLRGNLHQKNNFYWI